MTRTKILTATTLTFLFALSLLWSVPATAVHHEQAAGAAKSVYTCGCGTAANCDKMAAEPGNAPCGKPLIEKQVLKEDADKIYVCACPDGCKCGINPADPTKCACGKELRAYPKTGGKGCAQGAMGGCDKPCAKQATGGCDKPCNKQPAAGCDKPCCAKPAAAESNKPCCAKPAVAN